MRSTLNHILFLFLCITAISGCKEEYVYPRVKTEFCNAYTDASGSFHSILTDKDELFHIEKRKGLEGFTKDSTYRCIAKYTVPEVEDSIFLYSLQLTVSHEPTPLKEFMKDNKEGIIRNPVTLQRIWSCERFINMVILQKNKNIPHRYHLIGEEIQTDEHGIQTAGIIIYHNRMEDYEAFNSEVYVSIPLTQYNEAMGNGDKIQVKLTTYEGGEETRTFIKKGKEWILTDQNDYK